MAHNSDAGRYSTSEFSATTTGGKSLNNKNQNIIEDVPTESHEEGEAQDIDSLPPKPKPKKAPKKSTAALNVDSTTESHEEGEAQDVDPPPPQPKPKKAPKKSTAARNVDPTHNMKPFAVNPIVVHPPLQPNHPGSVWQQPRPPSPETIYEILD